ncbi:serine/threonine-protein phosphatase [Embleya sp. NBC_00888]|uniref:PP2C family protein-serine/threonine phosphatase n=1 Tax=Embleya sp. NBC_00888 TaxID=2975960 RepID=UPI00386BA0FC|nr:serine/threonine-protein phosphatase [Embleya sp. NBC_00888]
MGAVGAGPGRLLVSSGTRDHRYDPATAWRVYQGEDGSLTVSTDAWQEESHTLMAIRTDWYADAAAASAAGGMPPDVAGRVTRALGTEPVPPPPYRDFAEAFRAGVTPSHPEPVAGLELAVRHRPAQDEFGVGGDWYDVFTLDDGQVALVVGDVQGHGAGTAPIMARIRTLLHAYAVVTPDPGRTLALVNDFLDRFPGPAYATCTLAYLDPATGSLRVARAAHPPLLLADPAGTPRIEDVEGGLPLGMLADQGYPCTTLTVAPGETLVLVTDGLVEGPQLSLDRGMERLAHRFERSRGLDLEATAERLFGLADLTGHRDDVTLLLARTKAG